jgi:predicted transposase YbfD/YdcC
VSVSSLIPDVVREAAIPVVAVDPLPVDLLAALTLVVDPRARRGVRHCCSTVLALGVCAVLAGAKTFTAISEWAADLTPIVRARLNVARRPPCESTIRRVLQRVDPDALDRVLSAWLAARRPGQQPGATPLNRPRPVIAVDGKTARGSRHHDVSGVHLLAAFDTGTGVVLGQARVDTKSNEITAFGPLLDRIDLAGVIVTADALHTQRGHGDYLIGRGAHYLLTVKANQPTLLAQLRSLPWLQVPVADQTSGKGHGRCESRTVKITAVAAGIGFPHARLAIQMIRRRRRPASRTWQSENVYALTDLDWDQTTPAELADALRAHWGIENRLHWIRDTVFAEDLSQVRTGHGPQVMASLRNAAVSLHRLTGTTSIAAATRHLSRHPNRVLPLLG